MSGKERLEYLTYKLKDKPDRKLRDNLSVTEPVKEKKVLSIILSHGVICYLIVRFTER